LSTAIGNGMRQKATATVAYTDGAAKGNPGPGGWGVVIVAPDGQVSEFGGGAAHTTNNQMELTAAIEALRRIPAAAGLIVVYTDSTYLIRGITEWLGRWRRRGWKTATGTAVLNREYWEELDGVLSAHTGPVSWRHVPGHAGVAGNERADAIATAVARGRRPHLYRGPVEGSALAGHAEPATSPSSRPERASGKRTGAAYSYLSVVDGKPMRHATWAECERRVKGRSGARFKKAVSASDEALILRGWGFSLEDV
jgi:ribonuclease HI